MLVGGGELHDRWSSLVGVAAPLSRGHPALHRHHAGDGRRGARRPRRCCPSSPRLLRGRVLVAHNGALRPRRAARARSRARRWTGRSRPSSARSRWRAGSRRCSAAAGSPRWPTRSGSRSSVTHRALPDAETCARVFCALFGAPERARGDDRRGGRAARPARGGARRAARAPARAAGRRPSARTSRSLPHDPGVYVFRDADGRPLYVGKSVCLRTRARAHFTTPRGVDGARRARRLPGDAVRARRAAARGPADQDAAPARQQARQARARTATSTCAAGSTSRSRSSRSRPSPRAGTPSPSARCAAAPRRPSWSSSSTRCSGCATAGGGCRGASTRAPTGRWAAACRRASATSTRTSTASGSTAALRLFVDRRDGGAALLAHLDAPDAARRRRSATSSARRGCSAGASASRRCSRRLGGLLRATHAGARLVLAPHPAKHGRFDAFWIAGGRVVDWGALPADPRRARARTAAALRAAPRPRARRLAPGRRGRGDAARRLLDGGHAPPALELDARAIEGGRLARWVRAVASAA